MEPTLDEEWRPAIGYEGSYEVSSLGRVKSVDRVIEYIDRRGASCRSFRAGRVLKPGRVRNAHLYVNLGKGNSQYVHTLVAAAFLGERPEGLEVCHNDGDATNNCVNNLRYDTHAGNYADMFRHGTHPQARKTHCKNGHEFSAEDTSYRIRKDGWHQRVCLICKREQAALLRANGATW